MACKNLSTSNEHLATAYNDILKKKHNLWAICFLQYICNSRRPIITWTNVGVEYGELTPWYKLQEKYIHFLLNGIGNNIGNFWASNCCYRLPSSQALAIVLIKHHLAHCGLGEPQIIHKAVLHCHINAFGYCIIGAQRLWNDALAISGLVFSILCDCNMYCHRLKDLQ